MFSNNSQLTFGGSRTVKSVFGGCKIDDFDFFDVRNLVKDVGLSVVKYKVVKLQGANTQTKT